MQEHINLAADPVILKDQGPRGPRRVDPGTQAEHHPRGYAPADDAEVDARNASFSQPGRYSDVVLGEKPAKDETPYRSKWFVVGRHSADGNDYAVGEPIPLAEAIRQGMAPQTFETPSVNVVMGLTGDDITVGNDRTKNLVCTKCNGLKKSPKMFERHGPEVGHCPACRPCGGCEGRGFILEEALDEVEVTP